MPPKRPNPETSPAALTSPISPSGRADKKGHGRTAPGAPRVQPRAPPSGAGEFRARNDYGSPSPSEASAPLLEGRRQSTSAPNLKAEADHAGSAPGSPPPARAKKVKVKKEKTRVKRERRPSGGAKAQCDYIMPTNSKGREQRRCKMTWNVVGREEQTRCYKHAGK